MNNVDIKQVAKWDQEHFGILCLQRERERERDVNLALTRWACSET